jgi:hypothetical protein
MELLKPKIKDYPGQCVWVCRQVVLGVWIGSVDVVGVLVR